MEEMKKLKENGNEKQTKTFEEETESESGSEKEGDKSEIEERPELIKPNKRLHKHPMTFRSGDVVGPSNSLGCRGCWRLVEGTHYACDDERCKYYLHEFCYNLPQTISNHPLHSEHKLILMPGSSAYSAECRVCGKQCKGSRYHCLRCPGFDIDLLCAWVPSTIQTRAHHQHNSLSLISRPSIFSCDACDIEFCNTAFSYMCFTCQYWVHLDCALGPLDDDLRTRMSDNHPLELRKYCFNFCKLCEKQIERACYMYGCEKCNQYSHIGCVALATLSLHTCVEASLMDHTDDLGEQRPLIDLDMDFFFASLLSEAPPHKIEGIPIQHWSHDHQDHLLKFGASTDESLGIDRRRFKCNGCNWPLTAPFYSCMKCNFFLHIECAELMEFRIAYTHNHGFSKAFPIASFLKIELISEGSRCSHCNNPYSGFSYKCQQCEYRLDPSCADINENILHLSHQHRLHILEATLKHPKNCNACGESIEKKRTAYFCSFCEFYLHIKCASLPKSSRHRFDRHELRLMFKSSENKLGEYICDVCEDENRNPNLWFYGCEECDFAAHVDCIRDQ